MNKRFYSIFSGSYYVHYSSVPSYFHVGNGSLMGLLVVRILWRNVKRKQEYPNPFLKSKFSFAISLSYHVTLLWQMPLIENWFSLSLSLSLTNEIINRAIPVGAVSYMDIDGYRYKRDVLFCYDLKLPASFRPENQGRSIQALPSSVALISS